MIFKQIIEFLCGNKNIDLKNEIECKSTDIVPELNILNNINIERLKKYEVRRQEVADSNIQINGIFYIYNEQIIPDYFSEYPVSDTDSEKEKERYHFIFFKNYLKLKFPHLPNIENYLPRGRIDVRDVATDLYIDNCYGDNEDILNKLTKLYNVKGKVNLICNGNYRCNICKGLNKDADSFRTYHIKNEAVDS